MRGPLNKVILGIQKMICASISNRKSSNNNKHQYETHLARFHQPRVSSYSGPPYPPMGIVGAASMNPCHFFVPEIKKIL
jgi:hypothetical protein